MSHVYHNASASVIVCSVDAATNRQQKQTNLGSAG